MEIYVMRHGIAAARETWGDRPDRERPLTPKGEKRMRAVARGMKRAGLEFGRILTSPYLRARRTAEIVGDVLGFEEKIEESTALEPGGSPEALIRTLGERTSEARGVLLVGHEPDLGELVSLFVTGARTSEFRMKKGGVAALATDRLALGACARLEWLLAPRHWIAIAGEP